MTITLLPSPPSRNDPTTFADKGDVFLAALPTFVIEANALETNVNAKEASAAASAESALNSAGLSANSAAVSAAASGASNWNASTTYTVGQSVFSPINQRAYRRKIAGVSATDPSLDTTNWGVIAQGLVLVTITTSTFNLLPGYHYAVTSVAASTGTLPASPSLGDEIKITFANNLANNIVARNGNTIMGYAEDLTIDSIDTTIQLRYINNDWKIL